MPNSLKSRIKKLEHQGLLSEKDLPRIYTDNDVIEELEKIKTEIQAEYDLDKKWLFLVRRVDVEKIIDKHISELKGE